MPDRAGGAAGRGFRLSDDQMAAVALSSISGLGPARLRLLARHFGSMATALRVSPERLREVPGIGPVLAREICRLDAEAEVVRQTRLALRVSARITMKEDRSYPPLLREIYDPPPFLWMRGRSDVPLDRPIAIVGSRRATRYGKEAAFMLAHGLARAGCTIVSGLAYGIDAAAHRGALEANGDTVAVLGSGVDVAYPGANRALFRSIVEAGAVYSEFSMGTKPDATNFPRRNRLISGISLGVIVVESYDQGGGLITARFALDQNREVFSVPGPITSMSSVGSNGLVRDGEAKLITSVQDVLDEFPSIFGPANSSDASARVELSSEERRLVLAIEQGGSGLDEISVRSGIESASALVKLLSLEMRGIVRQGFGGVFYLAPFGSSR